MLTLEMIYIWVEYPHMSIQMSIDQHSPPWLMSQAHAQWEMHFSLSYIPYCWQWHILNVLPHFTSLTNKPSQLEILWASPSLIFQVWGSHQLPRSKWEIDHMRDKVRTWVSHIQWWAPLCHMHVFLHCAYFHILSHAFTYLLHSLYIYDLWHAYLDSDIVLWYIPMIHSLMCHICNIFHAFIMLYTFLCLFRSDFHVFDLSSHFWLHSHHIHSIISLVLVHIGSDHADIGFDTGNPWVGFSYTVPEPAEPVPVCRYYPPWPVICVVWYKTCGTARTRRFIIICYSSNLMKAAGTSIDVCRAFCEVGLIGCVNWGHSPCALVSYLPVLIPACVGTCLWSYLLVPAHTCTCPCWYLPVLYLLVLVPACAFGTRSVVMMWQHARGGGGHGHDVAMATRWRGGGRGRDKLEEVVLVLVPAHARSLLWMGMGNSTRNGPEES